MEGKSRVCSELTGFEMADMRISALRRRSILFSIFTDSSAAAH